MWKEYGLHQSLGHHFGARALLEHLGSSLPIWLAYARGITILVFWSYWKVMPRCSSQDQIGSVAKNVHRASIQADMGSLIQANSTLKTFVPEWCQNGW
jgi:hypothetical protein